MKKPEQITSLTNNRVKELASLSTRKGRIARNSFPAEGVRVIEECITCGAKILRVAVVDERVEDAQFKDLLENASFAGAAIFSVSREIMKKISGMQTPPGIFAEVQKPASAKLAALSFSAPVVMACEVRDPRNAGLLVRTAAGAGAEAVIFSAGSVDPFHPEAVQSSMGGLFHIPIIWDIPAEDVVNAAKENKATVVATVASGGLPAGAWAERCGNRFLLLCGNEGTGLPGDIEQAADHTITLPMHNNMESLNVAVSAGVMLYMAQAASSK